MPVVTARVQRRDVPVYLSGLGRVQALSMVTVKSQIDGRILRIVPREGQDVRAGELLVQIDPRPARAALDQALAKSAQDGAHLAYARKVLERDAGLLSKGLLDQQSFDLQQATVAQDEALANADAAAVQDARLTLDYTEIVSPIDGRVGLRMVDEGNIVHASDASGLLTVARIRPISVVFSVPDTSLSELHAAMAEGGTDLALKVEAFDRENDGLLDTGTLAAVDNQVDPASGTIRLKGVFDNPQLRLWPGQFVNVRLQTSVLRKAIVVASRAVQQGPKGDFVFVAKQDLTAEIRPIAAGAGSGDVLVVERGLSEGEVVIVDGQFLLKAGSRLAPAP